MASKKTKYKVDQTKIDQVISTVHKAAANRKGVFKNGTHQYLPQHNIPEEINGRTKALYLWTRIFCDRQTDSQVLRRAAERTWQDFPQLFFPEDVIKMPVEDVKYAMTKYMKFAMNEPGKAHKSNVERLIWQYDGDPRNIIKNQTVENAIDRITQFRGFGDALACLVITEFHSSETISPIDPKEIRGKVDRWKARIMVNTGAIEPRNKNEPLVHGSIARYLSFELRDSCKRQGIDSTEADAALWILGSESCEKNRYGFCVENCPLYDGICLSKVATDERRGHIIPYKDGKRTETRPDRNQGLMSFMHTEV